MKRKMRLADRGRCKGQTFSGLGILSWAIGVTLICLPALAAASDLRAGIETLAGDLLANLPADRRLTVAVSEFPDLQGMTSDLSRYVAERLTTLFSQSQRVAVVERKRVSQVLGELGWSLGDLLDPTKASRIRQMAGVEGVLVGTITDLGLAVEIEARLVGLETSHILIGATAMIPKDESVGTMMARGRQLPAPPAEVGLLRLPGEVPKSAAAEPGFSHLLMYATPGGRWRYEIKIEREEGLLSGRKVSQQGIWTLVHEGLFSFGGSEAYKLRGEYRIGNASRTEIF